MSKTLIWNSNLGGPTTTANTTEYWNPIAGPAASHTTEAQAEFKTRNAGTLADFYVKVGSVVNGGTHTFRTRVNAANGNQSVTVNGTGVFEDTTNTDSLAAADRFCLQTTPSGSTNLFTWWHTSNTFAATTDSPEHPFSYFVLILVDLPGVLRFRFRLEVHKAESNRFQ